MRGIAWTPKQERSAKKLLRGGTSLKKVAKTLKRTPGAVTQRMYSIGVSLKGIKK